jgi:hypothetical protein
MRHGFPQCNQEGCHPDCGTEPVNSGGVTFDWDHATVRLTVPVYYTASVGETVVNMPIKELFTLMKGQDSLPLHIPDEDKK